MKNEKNVVLWWNERTVEVNDEKETNQKNKGQNHALSFVFCPLVFCLGLFLSFTLSPDNRCETREVTARKGSVTAAVWCNEGEVNGRKKRASFVHSFITFFCSISLLTSSPVIGPQSTGVSQGVFCCCCASFSQNHASTLFHYILTEWKQQQREHFIPLSQRWECNGNECKIEWLTGR